MKYFCLGDSDIKVSAIALGTMTWGEQNSLADAFLQMDYALSQGVNFFDAAEMYPVPPKADTYGQTENIIGEWLTKTGNRNKIILATKVVGRSNGFPYIRDGNLRLDRKNITQALEASLKRLRTDYIDLYQLHWPDRITNYFGKLGYDHEDEVETSQIVETLSVLNDLINEGKIRTIGLSNETPWGVMKFLQLSEKHQLPTIKSIQNPYNLLNRSYEIGMAEVSHRENVGLLAYSPLAFGVLSGKYLGGRKPADCRITLFERFSRYSNAQAEKAVAAYVALANEHQLDPAQMALAFVNNQTFLTSNIIGATSMLQLKANIESAKITLTEDVLSGIESIHTRYPNPCP